MQAPASYTVQVFDGKAWQDAKGQRKTPAAPVGGQLNEVRFERVEAERVVFTHRGKARSGVGAVLVWPE